MPDDNSSSSHAPTTFVSYSHSQNILRIFDIFCKALVKRSVILRNKNCISEWHHELPNILGLKTFGNSVISEKSQNFMELETSAHSPSQNEYSINTCKKFRSSHPDVLLGKDVRKICSKFTGAHPLWGIEITLLHGCSPVSLLHIFRTPFF